MAITRREFTTSMAALAAAVGLGSAEIGSMTEAFAGNTNGSVYGGTLNKPRVVWIHGAECTGCSTSLLSFLEDTNGNAVFGTTVTTGTALGLAGVTDAAGTLPAPTVTLAGATRSAVFNSTIGAETNLNIADVVIDVIDLQYHETIMGMGGDLAANWLKDFVDFVPDPLRGTTGHPAKLPGDWPFVLVVEGALQDKNGSGAWHDTAGNGKSWCSIGHTDGNGTFNVEIDMPDTVVALADKSTCVGIIPIGQCASYGGYPGCKPQISATTAGTPGAGGFDPTASQSGAMGTYDYLVAHSTNGSFAKVVNVPGCPTNPWWFCLTVVLFMVNLTNSGYGALMATDYGRRLKAVYPIPVHSAWCPHYGDYNNGNYALKAGDPGCLQKIGCKGIMANSLCGLHGWNNQQPQNAGSLASLNGGKGGHCTKAGHPCMACTEKGYPDSFVPFVKK